MHDTISALVIISLLITVGILFTGIFSMLRGGEFNRRNSNRLMQARVISQAVTIGFLALWFLTGR